MTEIFSPHVELPKPTEAIGPAELEEVLRRARAPIIREGFAEPWAEDAAAFDPAQAGWEQAAGNVLAKIQKMQSSGLVQLTPEGLTPKQAAEKAGEAAKLAEANARAAELAEQLRQRLAAGAAPRPPVEAPPPPAEAEEPADEPEEEEVEGQVKSGLSKFLESVPWKRIALEGATVVPPLIFGGTLGYFSPETARNISVAVGSAGVGLAFTSMAAAMAERILPAHARVGLLGKALVAAKVGGLYGGNVLLSTAIGTYIGAGIRAGIEALQAAAQQAGVGEGSGLVDPYSGQFSQSPDVRQLQQQAVARAPGGVVNLQSPDAIIQSGQPPAEAAGGQPPVLSPEAGEFVNRAGEVAAQEAQEMADAAQGAAELTTRQAALEAATRVHAVNPNETLSAIVSRYGGDPMGVDMTHTVVQSAGELTSGTDLAGKLRSGATEAGKLIEYLRGNPTVTWRQAINEGLKTAGGESVAKLFADATRMIFSGKLLNVVVGAGVP